MIAEKQSNTPRRQPARCDVIGLSRQHQGVQFIAPRPKWLSLLDNTLLAAAVACVSIRRVNNGRQAVGPGSPQPTAHSRYSRENQ